jgi:hypothetical protein
MRLFIFLLIVQLFASPKHFAQLQGELLSNTDYDYSSYPIANQIEMVDLDNDGNPDPVIMNSYRNISAQLFGLSIYYKVGGVWDTIQPFGSNYRPGGLKYCQSGALTGKFIAYAGSGAQLSEISIIDPTTWQYNTYQSNININSMVYMPDGTMLATQSFGHIIYKSTDNGLTFTEYTTIGSGDPTVNLLIGSGGLQVIKSSVSGRYVSYVGTYEDGAVNGTDDIVYFYHSSDFGVTWQGKIIGVDGVYGQVVNRNYAPLFENFGQLNFEVDDNGVTHVVINGYGEGVLQGSSDTTDVFPVLYWNSRDEDWIAITDQSIEYPTDGFGNVRRNLRAGNGIGNAYPAIAITPDGNGVAVIYQAIEFWGGIGSTYNIYPGDGGSNSIPIAYTTLYVNISDNSGQSWYYQFYPLDGFENSKLEQFPICAPIIEDLGFPFLFKVHYIYQYDEIPGVSIFNQNTISENGGWYYHNYFHIGTDVSDESGVITDFRLSQNYPNPFNPSTTISWQSPVSGHQTLKIYDVLGNEVATLVNEFRNAGSYEVDFDASKLSSGVYFYKLQAGDFVQTKKMLLMK